MTLDAFAHNENQVILTFRGDPTGYECFRGRFGVGGQGSGKRMLADLGIGILVMKDHRTGPYLVLV